LTRDGPDPVILAAEDNATNRLVLSKMLASEPLTLRFAETGAEAVEAWSSDPPDLILMDLSMPGMDGIEATRLIRAQEAETGQKRTPIIAVTAHVLKDAEAEVREAGMDGYIGKPMRKADVLELLAHWVGDADQSKAQA
jgi:CheY-like chemotaxis protein